MIKGQVQKDNRGLLAVRYYNRYNSYYHTERRLLWLLSQVERRQLLWMDGWMDGWMERIR
jgi:hypothetical protein